MEKWIVNYKGKNSEPVSMVRVACKAIEMYVDVNKNVISDDEFFDDFFGDDDF